MYDSVSYVASQFALSDVCELMKLAEQLRLEKVTILTYTGIVNRGYFQRNRCDCRGSPYIPNQNYLILLIHDLVDEIAFAYEGSFAAVEQSICLARKKSGSGYRLNQRNQ